MLIPNAMHLISRDFGVGQVLVRLQRPIKVDAKRIKREEGRDTIEEPRRRIRGRYKAMVN